MDFFSHQGHWLQFDYYRTREVDGRLYITPSKGSDCSWYRPLQVEALLIDFLTLASTLAGVEEERGSALEKATSLEDQEEVYAEYRRKEANKIVPFYRQYGMLGLFWDSLAMYSVEADQVLLVPRPGMVLFPAGRKMGLTGWVKYSDYAEYFFPGRKIPPLAKHRTLDFSRRYHEDVSWVADAFRYFFHKAELLRRFGDSGRGLDDQYRPNVTWKKALDAVWSPESVQLALGYDGVPTLDFRFRSLLSAANLRLIQSIAGLGEPYRICTLEGCSEPFFPKQPSQRYCCDTHENRDAQRRWRKRQKQQN